MTDTLGRRTSSLVYGAGQGNGFGLPSWRSSGSVPSPFAIVFALAVPTAALAAALFPTAHTLPEVIRYAGVHLG